ncbi:MAG: hypothetical protein K2J08_08045 [Ruminococcus sp.]|nr:hypothetical protein [Ruminococcus sp.]
MEQYIYEKITDDFVMLRYFTSFIGEEQDFSEEINLILADFERISLYIEKRGNENEKKILLYSLKMAREFILSGQFQTAHDFCYAVHNICELFTTHNWRKKEYFKIYIKPFRKKYGKNYFSDFLKYDIP